jgi:hypothetical protein
MVFSSLKTINSDHFLGGICKKMTFWSFFKIFENVIIKNKSPFLG